MVALGAVAILCGVALVSMVRDLIGDWRAGEMTWGGWSLTATLGLVAVVSAWIVGRKIAAIR
jgi:hypothetical protein